MKNPIQPAVFNKSEASVYLKLDVRYLNEYIKAGMIKTHNMSPYKGDRISKEQLDNFIKRNENYTSSDEPLLRARAIIKEMYDNKFKRRKAS